MVMPSVQIICNCPSLKDFTTFAYNMYEKVKPLVHDAVDSILSCIYVEMHTIVAFLIIM